MGVFFQRRIPYSFHFDLGSQAVGVPSLLHFTRYLFYRRSIACHALVLSLPLGSRFVLRLCYAWRGRRRNACCTFRAILVIVVVTPGRNTGRSWTFSAWIQHREKYALEVSSSWHVQLYPRDRHVSAPTSRGARDDHEDRAKRATNLELRSRICYAVRPK